MAVYKKIQKEDLGSYRSVGLTWMLGKVMKRIIFSAIRKE